METLEAPLPSPRAGLLLFRWSPSALVQTSPSCQAYLLSMSDQLNSVIPSMFREPYARVPFSFKARRSQRGRASLSGYHGQTVRVNVLRPRPGKITSSLRYKLSF